MNKKRRGILGGSKRFDYDIVTGTRTELDYSYYNEIALTWDRLKSQWALELDILGVPFGGHLAGRDMQGEAFYKGTDINLEPGEIVPLTYFHDRRPNMVIGLAKYVKMTKDGYLFLGLMDRDTELGKRIVKAIDQGKDVKASSGSEPEAIKRDNNGLIRYWPVVEISIFDTNNERYPANQLATVKRHLKYDEEALIGKHPSEIALALLDTREQLDKAAAYEKRYGKCDLYSYLAMRVLRPDQVKTYKRIVDETYKYYVNKGWKKV